MSEIHASREDAKARRDIEEVAAIVVDRQLIVELKSVENIHPVHPKQLLTYLRLMNLPLGLLHQLRVFAPSRAPTGGAVLKPGGVWYSTPIIICPQNPSLVRPITSIMIKSELKITIPVDPRLRAHPRRMELEMIQVIRI